MKQEDKKKHERAILILICGKIVAVVFKREIKGNHNNNIN